MESNSQKNFGPGQMQQSKEKIRAGPDAAKPNILGVQQAQQIRLGWTVIFISILQLHQCRMDSRIILLPISEQQDGQLVATSYVDKMDSSNYKDGQPNYIIVGPVQLLGSQMDSNIWQLALSKMDRFPQLLGEPNYISSYIRITGWTAYRYFI